MVIVGESEEEQKWVAWLRVVSECVYVDVFLVVRLKALELFWMIW